MGDVLTSEQVSILGAGVLEVVSELIASDDGHGGNRGSLSVADSSETLDIVYELTQLPQR